MNIKEVNLLNFRNYKTLDIELTEGINVLYGHNAQGKTNLLEAVYMCGIGRSHRTHNVKELINIDSEAAKIKVSYETGSGADEISVFMQKDGKKSIYINGITIKKIGEIFGCLLTVMFSPEDLWLVKSGPQNRRKFMDMELCQLSPIYYYDLKQYYKALNQRNNLLKTIKSNKENREMLFIWDEQLLTHGLKIMRKREEFIQKIDILSQEIYGKMTSVAGTDEMLGIKYKASVSEENFARKLEGSIERDIMLGSTSVGIHKDDIGLYINGNDLKVYGSQGQQRTAAIALKIAEVEIIREIKNIEPIFLLDDVLSELDEKRQKWLFTCVKELQVIVTCAEKHKTVKKVADKIFWVSNGNIINE